MTDFASISQVELADRRRKLRKQRRTKVVQTIWRSIAVSGLAVGSIWGVVWVTTLPGWVIRQPDQVVIEGNKLLSTQAVQALVPIAYPKSLLGLQPEAIAQQLEETAPIAKASVTRGLFPPSLMVEVTERLPIAVAYSSGASGAGASGATVGLLDEKGAWMPLESYTSFNQSFQVPALKVTGNPEQYRSQWEQFYRILRQSPVQVSEVDWQNPANLILHTELGIVHFGSFSPRFAMQLRVLDQMRQLPKDVDPGEMAYIDLANPQSPLIQMIEATPTPPTTPDPTIPNP